MADHFEPGTGGVTPETEIKRVSSLAKKYPEIVKGHMDRAGNLPKRTWFFPPHYHRFGNLRRLVELCESGFGEIELHLHHGVGEPDSPENLKKTIESCIKEYSRFGIFGTEEGKKRYAFIHGKWALDNSLGGMHCGVNSELKVLNETGCYADFTFPSLNITNPLMINEIFYATDDPARPKSYNRGEKVRRFGRKTGDLMLIEGPVHPFFMERSRVKRKFFTLRALGDAITDDTPVTSKRAKAWVNAAVHVKGKREWVFVKTSTHGAVHEETVLGPKMKELFGLFETEFNDGKNHILHYVTAREMYNVIKAVESGRDSDDPEEHRNHKISPPAYASSQGPDEASDELKGFMKGLLA